jgi:predicted O-linked N-acetylglucosamine transferase (SPINDLY family)
VANTADVIRTAFATARSGRPQQAVEDLRRSLRVHVDDPDLHGNLGLLLLEMGQQDQALYHLERGAAVAPGRADLQSNYGTALNMMGRQEEAVGVYRKAVAADPKSFPAQLGLSSALFGLKNYDGAIEAGKAAAALNPRAGEPWINLGLTQLRAGFGEEALATFRRGLETAGEHPLLLMNLAAASHAAPGLPPREVLEIQERWGRLLARMAGAANPLFPDMNPDRRLRVGYLCPDHPDRGPAAFVRALLERHDTKAFEPFVYSTRPAGEPDSAGLDDLIPRFDASRVPDPMLEQRIRADKIDILVCLAGYGPTSRLALLSRRPAPVQVSYLGCPGTTGLKAVGYRIGDNTVDGPEELGTEKLVRLEGTCFAWSPPADAPDVTPRAGQGGAGGGVAFGCFATPLKINGPVMDAWAQILKAVPGSRLLLRNEGFAAEQTRRNFLGFITGRGIAQDRVEIRAGDRTTKGHLAGYAEVDVALDTFPCNGMATTCEALWMGVPVVTFPGAAHAGRIGSALLTTAGLKELVAADREGYVARAVELAKDAGRRAELRRTLRDRVKGSALMDGAALTRKIEAEYRSMWKAWCGGVYYEGGADPVQFVKE